jgi:hypothetical protein
MHTMILEGHYITDRGHPVCPTPSIRKVLKCTMTGEGPEDSGVFRKVPRFDEQQHCTSR